MASSGLNRYRQPTASYTRLNNGHRRQTWILLTAWLILLITLGMFASLYLIPRPIPVPSLSFSPDKIHLATPEVCPGDEIRFSSTLNITDPMVVQTNISVLDMTTNATIPGTERQIPLRPRPFISNQDLTIDWTIPDLPAGDYMRVTGATALNQGSKAAFLCVPFTVKQDCP